MADYYNALVPARRYLKNIERLESDPTKGITRGDLSQAQASARAEVEAALGAYYDTSAWATSTPPIIADVAELLSSAHVLRYRYQREAPGKAMESNFAELLRSEGLAMLGDLKAGRRRIILGDGSVQQMKAGVGLSVPRVANP